MTITEVRISQAGVLEYLRYLARNWDDINTGGRALMLAGLTSPSLDLPPRHHPCPGCGDCLECVWHGYRADLAVLDGLRGEIWAEPRTWQDMDPDGELGLRDADDPQAAAEEIMAQHVADGEDRLTGIPARTRAGAA